MSRLKIIAILLLVSSLIACSSVVEIDQTRLSPGAPAKTYEKLLVVGIAHSPNLSKSFENIFAETLNKHGVAAVASHTVISDPGIADQNHLQDVARQIGADGVVITRVLTRSEHTNYTAATGHVEYRAVAETTTTADSSTTIAMSGVGLVPGEMDEDGATLQTNLFDADTARLTWTAFSRAAGDDNAQISVCWKLSALLTKALGDDQLVRLNSTEFKIPKAVQ